MSSPASPQPAPAQPTYVSKIAIFDMATRSSRVVFERPGIAEAPNWSRDGKYLLINADGDLFRLELGVEPASLARLPLGQGGYDCNNDHDLSPDGNRLALSARFAGSQQSQVFVAGADGGDVRLVTPQAPSYFHGWSPDGQWLAFVAERGDGNYELYRVPAEGGAEQRLTFSGGYDDGPEYSPDGKYIYFNSNRGGRWNIWRIPPTGGGDQDALAEQVTDDEPEDWFPHISPDGRHMVFIAFPPGTEGHNERMPGMTLRLLPVPGPSLAKVGTPETLLEFEGGQGSLNVNSWAPDSTAFAYVIYERQP